MTKAWALVDKNGKADASTVTNKRGFTQELAEDELWETAWAVSCIDHNSYVPTFDPKALWKEAQKRGYAIKRVEIRVIE